MRTCKPSTLYSSYHKEEMRVSATTLSNCHRNGVTERNKRSIRKAPVTYSKHQRNAAWRYDDRRSGGVWHTGSSQTCLSREQLEGQKLAAWKKCHMHQLLENSLDAVSAAGGVHGAQQAPTRLSHTRGQAESGLWPGWLIEPSRAPALDYSTPPGG